MNRDESRAFLRSDEDDPDYLRDKPMGRCPWCGSFLVPDYDVDEGWQNLHLVIGSGTCEWRHGLDELDNRARYAEQREAEAKIEMRVNRELRGRDGPY